MRSYVAVAVLAVALAVATVFAVWPALGDAPWEGGTACRDPASPCPSPSQEESEKVACLQGGGEWVRVSSLDSDYYYYCDPGRKPCWACMHPPK